MINAHKKEFGILVPIILVGSLVTVAIVHFFINYSFNKVTSVLPEHTETLEWTLYSIEVFIIVLTAVATVIFLSVMAIKSRKTREDNEKYLLAMESASNHIIITDVNGMIIYANKGAENMTGYTFEEMKGNTPRLWGGLMPIEHYKKLWQTIKYDHLPFSAEVKNRNKNQEEYYAMVNVSPIINANGILTGFVSTEENITERKEKDEELKAQQKKISETAAKDEALLENIGEGVIAVDKDRKVIFVNSIAAGMLGYDVENLKGTVITDQILEDENGNVIPFDKRPTTIAFATNKLTRVVYFFVRKDKTKFPIAITATPVKLEGKTIGLIEILRDITREKEVEKSKSEFVSLTSHQLRTPPTAIKWYAEYLLSHSENLNEKQKEYLNEIYKGNQRMIELINSLLNVSRIELGRFLSGVESVNLISSVKVILNGLNNKINEKKLAIEQIYQKNILIMNADLKLIDIIIENLLTNAVKYTPAGGKITIEIKIQDGHILFRVSDTGEGIPLYQQQKIFTKLFRADNANELDPVGSGLGLYITKSIVEQTGGKIWFDSVEKRGTDFYVSYPLEGMESKKSRNILT